MLNGEFSGTDLKIIASGLVLSSVLSLVSYLLIFNSLKGRPAAFISGVMISMMLKMFSGLASIFLVSWKFKELSIAYAVTFMIGYFVFVIPEMLFLNHIARKA